MRQTAWLASVEAKTAPKFNGQGTQHGYCSRAERLQCSLNSTALKGRTGESLRAGDRGRLRPRVFAN